MSDRVVRFPDRTRDELEGLPQPLRNAAHTAIFHLPGEPVPALAEPFPEADPLPGACRLHLPADGLTIWYTVTESPDRSSSSSSTSRPTHEQAQQETATATCLHPPPPDIKPSPEQDLRPLSCATKERRSDG